MNYKVIPFAGALDQTKTSSQHVADQLQEVIAKEALDGWEYVRLESVSTWVAGDSGCFGIGGKPGFATSRQVIVFKKT
jgi:hypothetical protein